MSKKLLALIGLGALLAAIVVLFKSAAGTELLWYMSDSGRWLLPLVAVSALIDAINPCAFAILLLTLTFLFSIGRLRESVLKIGGVYIFGIFLAYMLIGFGLLQAFHLFNMPGILGKIGASLVIVLGIINIAGHYWKEFPIKLKIPSVSHHKIASLMEQATVPTAFALGMLVGLCEFPCTGGPYLMVIGLLHDQATMVSGVFYLFLYNLVFVLPLVVILLIAGNKQTLDKVQTWRSDNMKNSRLIAGIIMILLGGLILAL